MPQLSEEQLKNLAKIAGGVGLLVLAALILTSSYSPQEGTILPVASVICSTGGNICEEDEFGEATLRLTADPASIASGTSTVLTWLATNFPDAAEVLCFSSTGASCNTTAFQTISFNAFDTETFTLGSDPNPYLTAVTYSNSSDTSTVATYKWNPSLNSGNGCFTRVGSTSCGTTGDTFTISNSWGNNIEVFTIPGETNPFLFVGSDYDYRVDSASNATSRLYQWVPTLASGRGCFSRPGASSCGYAVQAFSAGNLRYWGASAVVEPSPGKKVLIGGYDDVNTAPSTLNQGGRVFNWMPGGSYSAVPPKAGTSFVGQYYNNMTLTAPIRTTRNDSAVNFNWGTGAPASGVNVDGFSVRWTGTIVTPVTGEYTFYTVTNDGLRLWINNELVADHWPGTSARYHFIKRSFTAGQQVPVVMEYYDDTSTAVAQLLWSYPGNTGTAVRTVAAPGCFGSGGSCGSDNQVLDLDDTSTGQSIQPFVVNGAHYLAMIQSEQQGGTAGVPSTGTKLYKWIDNYNCYGNGTVCDTALYTVPSNNSFLDSGGIFKHDSDTYLYTLFTASGGSRGVKFYKWMPSSECFGNGSCGTPLPNQIPNSLAHRDAGTVFHAGGKTYFLYSYFTGTPDTGLRTGMFEWMPTQQCFGNGTACNTPYSTLLAQGVNNILGSLSTISINNELYAMGTKNTFKIFKSLNVVGGETSNCSVSDGVSTIGAGASSSMSVSPTTNTTYTFNCAGVGSVSVPVSVTAATPSVTIAPQDGTATEGQVVDNGIFQITRTGSTATPLTVNFSLGGTGIRNTDYSLSGASISGTSGLTATIPAIASVVNITVAPRTNDATPQGNKTAVMTIAPGAGYVSGSPGSALVTIVDSDTAAVTLPTITTCSENTDASASCSLGASPSRVRQYTEAMVSWHVDPISPTANCSIVASPAISGFSPAWNGVGTSWIGETAVTIPRATTFTLTCTDAGSTVTTQKTIGIIPSFQEI